MEGKNRELMARRMEVARRIEEEAANEFGPESLSRQTVADCLMVSQEQMTDAEWQTISEFAVNAGSDLMRAAVSRDLLKLEEGKDANPEQAIRENEYRLIPIHDLFHAAEVYRLSEGRSASSLFIEADGRDRYTNPEVLTAELYPLLFLKLDHMRENLAISLMTSEGREHVAMGFALQVGLPEKYQEAMVEMFAGFNDETPSGYRKLYERMVELVVIGNAEYEGITSQELAEIQGAFNAKMENPPQHYNAFVNRVFGGEFKENPRLFLDELLECID